MAKAKAARLLLKAGKSLLKRRNLLKVPKGKLTIPQKIKKVPIKGSIETRPTGLRRLRPDERIPRSRQEMFYRGVNRYQKPDGTLMDPRVKARTRKGQRVWATEPERVPVRKVNKGDSSPTRSQRINEQTIPDAPKSKITPASNEDIHHIVGLARVNPLFANLPKYKQIALAKWLAKRGYFTGNHSKNLVALKKLPHKLIHDFENKLVMDKLTSVGDAPITVRMPNIRRFMTEQNQVNAHLQTLIQ